MTYELGFTVAGIAILCAALLPAILRQRPMSVPIVLVALGAVAVAVVPSLGFDPRRNLTLTEHTTEFAVLLSLLAAGLSIDTAPGWKRWNLTWRLLAISMLLTVLGVALVASAVMQIGAAAALLLGAALAPTDPVLAAEVQVGEPTVDGAPHNSEDNVRLTLTSEAGLNDGLAFPFVYAAIAVATVGLHPGPWFAHWFAVDLLLRVAIGIGIGWVAGNALSRIVFDPPRSLAPLAESADGFVAIGSILITYGITELASGYGFLAVFVAAVTLRSKRRDHRYHRTLHQFTGQVEQLLTVALLLAVGGSIAAGVLETLTWRAAATAVLVIFVIRPASARLALMRSSAVRSERRAIEFFGIRGIGSIYYLSYATNTTEFDHTDELWAATIGTIILSIFVHGVTATPVMRALDRRRKHRV